MPRPLRNLEGAPHEHRFVMLGSRANQPKDAVLQTANAIKQPATLKNHGGGALADENLKVSNAEWAEVFKMLAAQNAPKREALLLEWQEEHKTFFEALDALSMVRDSWVAESGAMEANLNAFDDSHPFIRALPGAMKAFLDGSSAWIDSRVAFLKEYEEILSYYKMFLDAQEMRFEPILASLDPLSQKEIDLHDRLGEAEQTFKTLDTHLRATEVFALQRIDASERVARTVLPYNEVILRRAFLVLTRDLVVGIEALFVQELAFQDAFLAQSRLCFAKRKALLAKDAAFRMALFEQDAPFRKALNALSKESPLAVDIGRLSDTMRELGVGLPAPLAADFYALFDEVRDIQSPRNAPKQSPLSSSRTRFLRRSPRP